MVIEEAYCGNVLVTRGKFKGHVGYMDDVDGLHGIVYFGELFDGDYYLIRLSSLEYTEIESPGKIKFIKKHPHLASGMGIR